MLLSKNTDITIVPRNITYWKNRGYDNVILNRSLSVRIEDLPKNSNVRVSCMCDICECTYMQRAYRQTDVCGKCKLSTRMKNNILGQKNRGITIDKTRLLKDIANGATKSNIAEKYGVSIPVVNRWIKEHDMDVIPYYGRKYFKTIAAAKRAENICNEYLRHNKDANISEVSKYTQIPRHIINRMRTEGTIKITTQFDTWKEAYKNITDNLDFFVKENEKKTLIAISQENNISVEHLKAAFNDNDIPVKLHSYNKSKGEIECKHFIQSLDIQCFSARLEKMYEIDCYVPDKNFGLEYCDEYWHRYVPNKNNKYYHRNKYMHSEKIGVELMTIFECEWKTNRALLESMIRARLGLNAKIYARTCKIQEITGKSALDFHERNHISGGINSSINIGLFQKDELVSVISMIKSRFDKKYEYEIGRFSSKMNHTVVGGLSKLFAHFIKTYRPKSVITYSDLRFGSGKSYTKTGFEYAGMTVPNYFYFAKGGNELESRFKYQKNKLKKFSNYDSTKTEFEIMEARGYYRLYDCGNKKYIWKK